MPEAAFVHSSPPRSQRRASSVHSSPYPQALRRHHCPRLVAALKSSTPKLHSLIAARQPNVASGAIKLNFRPVPTSAESSRLKACGHHRLPPIIQSPSAILQSSNPPILQSSKPRGGLAPPPSPPLAHRLGPLDARPIAIFFLEKTKHIGGTFYI